MKLKTGLLLFLLAVGLAWGGAKYYLHTTTKEKLDRWAVMVSPFAELTYGEIDSDLRGSLAVEGLYLSTPDGAVVQAGRVQLEGSGPGFLLDLVQGFDQREPPEKLVLKVQRLAVPVDQNLRASFGMMNDEAALEAQPQPCTLGGLFRYAGLENIGIQQMVADAVMGYSLDKSLGSARMFFDYDLDRIESLSLNLEVTGLPEAGAVVMGRFPGVTDFELVYEMQPAYARQMVSFCAQQRKLTPAEFLADLFDRPDDYYGHNLGFIPGEGLRALLRQLLSDGGVVQITAAPPEDLDPSRLSAYRADQLIDLLGVEVVFNDKPVPDLGLRFALSGTDLSGVPGWSALGLPAPQRESEISAEEAAEEDASAPSSRTQMRYVEVAVADLPRYLGRSVKLYTRNTPGPKQGFLVSYKQGTFSVEQSVHRGKMTAHVSRADLARAEVLTPVQDKP